MRKQYFKKVGESAIGIGTLYFEYTGDLATRQAEVYGDRWFCSLKDSHPEIGLGLTDILLSESELGPKDGITEEEFEAAWQRAIAQTRATTP